MRHLLAQARIDCAAGRHEEALARLVASVRASARDGHSEAIAEVEAACGRIEFELGRDGPALRWFERAARTAEISGRLTTAAVICGTCALLHARAGRCQDARAALAHAGALAVSDSFAELASATVAARTGRPAEASHAADRAVTSMAGLPATHQILLTAGLTPVLADLDRRDDARALLDAALAMTEAAFPEDGGSFYRAWLLCQRTWVRGEDGDAGGALTDLAHAWRELGDGRSHVLRHDWDRLRPWIWRALRTGVLEPASAVGQLHRAWPRGSELLPFAGHPRARVRAAVAAPLMCSGHPEARARLDDLLEDPAPSVRERTRRVVGREDHAPVALEFRVLGRFEVRRGDWLVEAPAWGRPVASRLVRLLLVHRDTAVTEDTLFEVLWPGLSTTSARRSLQVALSRARAVLDVPHGAPGVLHVTERTYRLTLRGCDEVDADAFELTADAALDARGRARHILLEEAAEAWAGEPLPEDRYERWASQWRQALLERHAAVLGALRDSCSARGDHGGAIRAGRRLVESEPHEEDGHRALMAAYARSGRQDRALHQYAECRRALSEFGGEPQEATVRLRDRILTGAAV